MIVASVCEKIHAPDQPGAGGGVLLAHCMIQGVNGEFVKKEK
jgi:hypothetical protein